MSGHTPGPWIVEELDGYITGHVISPNKTNPSPGVRKPLSITDPSNMCAADAELIAAAPETAAELERAHTANHDLQHQLDAEHADAERLREINAELMEALTAILPVYKMWTEDGGHDPSVGIDATADWVRIEKAEAALAKHARAETSR